MERSLIVELDFLTQFSMTQWLAIGLIFVWTGFVRSGLGFGGAALGLPLMLLIENSPVFWLPIIGVHLLFFSSLTLSSALSNVDWAMLKRSLGWILPPVLIGVMGLVSLPNDWLVLFVYVVTLFYAIMWLLDKTIQSENHWYDKVLLVLGGYIGGTSLTGAPLMVAVFARHVVQSQLRNTLFVLWFMIVMIKMTAFVVLEVKIEWLLALALLPVAAIGHVIGLRFHQRILQNSGLFKRVMGGNVIGGVHFRLVAKRLVEAVLTC